MDMDEIAVRWSSTRVRGYEERKRRKSPGKWDNEHRVVAEILHEIGPGRKDMEQPLRELRRVPRSDLIVGAGNIGPLHRRGLGSLGRLVKRQTQRTLRRPLRKVGAGRKPLMPFKQSVDWEFRRVDLEVKRRVVVEQRSDGTEGAVYWLKRKVH